MNESNSENIRRGGLMAGHGFLLLHIAGMAGDWRAFDDLLFKQSVLLSLASLLALIGIGSAYIALCVQGPKPKMGNGFEALSVGLFCMIAGMWIGVLLPKMG